MDEEQRCGFAPDERNGVRMMKRISLALVILACLLCAAVCASADILEYTLLEDGSGYEITGCNDSAEVVTIPAEHKGLPVLSIDGKAFISCGQLEEFRTEEDQPVFYAEDGVLFTDRPVKTLVRFPNRYRQHDYYKAPADLKAVGPWAFAGLNSMNFIHFQEGLESFGDHMLDSVKRGPMFFVPDSLKVIGKNLLQNMQSSVAFYGSENCAFCEFAWGNNIPYGIIGERVVHQQTAELAEPDLTDAGNLPAPKKTVRIDYGEFVSDYYSISYDFSAHQGRKGTELLMDLGEIWTDITPDMNGQVADGLDPRTGIYGIGFTGAETVLRGYDREGNLTGTRVVNGDFVFSLPGAYSVGITGGKDTVLTVLPYQPILIASSGKLPLDQEHFHRLSWEDGWAQYYVVPFGYASGSYDYSSYMNVFTSSFYDAAGNEAVTSPHYALKAMLFWDPYLLDQADQVAIDFDHLDVLYEDEGFTCAAASRFNLDGEFGKQLSGLLDTVKTVMSGTYYPADRGINHVTVRVNGEYPMSSDSVITVDKYLAEYTDDNILSFAHEMTHAVDQRLTMGMPGAWMEGRAEYISRKVCDILGISYWEYEDRYDWAFLSAEDRADFFRYYTESANRETEYSVGYYFFRYLCDTYGEDISVKIMQNLFDAAGELPPDEWKMPNDIFKKCVTDATDPDVFRNFVRDVVEK